MSNVIRADFAEVNARLREAIKPLDTTPELVPLLEAQGRILAEDIRTQFDFPLFDNSAMDGFAIRTIDFASGDATPATLPVCGLATAGHPFAGDLPAGTALRIMTGAPLPAGFDAVIPIEKTEIVADGVRFAPGLLKAGENVRRQGEIFRAGECLLTAPRLLTRADLGLAASLGYARLACHPRLRIAVFSSGDELVPPADGTPLADGLIYNANGTFATLAARALGADADDLGILPDDPSMIESRLAEAINRYDLIVCSGGVGPGDCDFTAAVLNRLADLHHYHVAMRPGKPFSFGSFHHSGKLLLGLPGNPVATATSAEFFLRTAVRAMQGLDDTPLTFRARLDGIVKTKPGRCDFIRGTLSAADDGTLVFRPASQQSSASLLGVSQSNAVAIIPEASDGRLTDISVDVLLQQ